MKCKPKRTRTKRKGRGKGKASQNGEATEDFHKKHGMSVQLV